MSPRLASLPNLLLRWARRQPLLISFAVAIAVSVGLGVLVLAPLIVAPARGTDTSVAGAVPGLSAPDPPPAPETRAPDPTTTPTPWPRRPRDPSPTPESEPTATPERNARVEIAETATATPEPTHTPVPRPTATPTPEPPPALYLAEAGAGLEAWGGPNWFFDGRVLVNDGGAVSAQPWLTLPESVPVDGSYAVEAEFQILGVARGYCQQTFGVVSRSASGEAYLGGGLFYGCNGAKPLLRLTDVTDWANGYNQDPELAAAPLDPGTDWHTLRLEVEPGRVRLIVDGEVVLEAADRTPRGNALQTAQVGLWSQGVQVAIRRIAIAPLGPTV